MPEPTDERPIRCEQSGTPMTIPRPGTVAPAELGLPGSDYRPPAAVASIENPEGAFGAQMLSYGDSHSFAGYGFQTDDGFVVHLKGQEPQVFATTELRRQFYRDHNLRPQADEQIRAKGNYVQGWGTPNEWSAAPPWMRMISLGVARLMSNRHEAAAAVRALSQRIELDQLSRWERLVAKLDPKSMSTMEMLSIIPDPELERTPAGIMLNAAKWANNTILNNLSVLRDPRISPDGNDRLPAIEALRGEMAAQQNSEQAPVRRFARQFHQWVKTNQVSPAAFWRYRLALHTSERIHLVNEQYEALAKTDPEKAADYYMDRDDPTAFRHTTEAGQTLRGQAAADAYIASLSPEMREKFEVFNKIASGYQNYVLQHSMAEGIITRQDYEYYTQLTKNYVPLRSETGTGQYAGGVRRPAVRGRTTEAENIGEQFFDFLDRQNRRNWLNKWRKTIVDAVRDNQFNGLMHAEYREAVRGENGVSWKLPFEDKDNTITVWYPPEKEYGNPMVARITVDQKTWQGRGVTKLITAQNREPLFQTLAGTTRFLNLMVTTAQPAWMLKNLAWNTFVTPAALQSAGGLTIREANQLLWSGGMGPYFRDVVHMFRTGFREDMADPWTKIAVEMGAGSATNSAFSPIRSTREFEHVSDSFKNRMKTAAIPTLLQSGLKGVNAFLHFNHTPDMAFGRGAFKTLLEHYAQKSMTTEAEIRAFMRDNPELTQRALNGSRRILPNFSNTGNLSFLNALFPFFNATVQTAPFLGQLAMSGYGRASFALAAVLGYAGTQMAYDEHGNAADEMRGSDGSVYLGNGLAIPMDYAFHSAMTLGSGLYRVAHGRQTSGEYLADMGKSIISSFSPIDVPYHTQSWGAWGANNILPPMLKAPVLTMLGIDQNGRALANENPVDAQGHKLLNPQGWQTGLPRDSAWSTQLAKGLNSLTMGMAQLAPGQVSQMVNSYAPVVGNVASSLEGDRAMGRGDASPSILTRLRDTIAPGFTQTPAFAGEQGRFMATYREIVGPDATSINLLQGKGGATGRAAEALRREASHITTGMRIGGMLEPQLRAQIVAAQQAGDMVALGRLQNLSLVLRRQKNAVWDAAADKIAGLQ